MCATIKVSAIDWSAGPDHYPVMCVHVCDVSSCIQYVCGVTCRVLSKHSAAELHSVCLCVRVCALFCRCGGKESQRAARRIVSRHLLWLTQNGLIDRVWGGSGAKCGRVHTPHTHSKCVRLADCTHTHTLACSCDMLKCLCGDTRARIADAIPRKGFAKIYATARCRTPSTAMCAYGMLCMASALEAVMAATVAAAGGSLQLWVDAGGLASE